MIKEYKADDGFKRWARALQFAYREEVLHDYNEYRAPQVLLNVENAKRGLIFYDGYLSKQFRFKVIRLVSSSISSRLISPIYPFPQ